MKVGDLVVCACVSGRPMGLIVAKWNGNHHTSKYVFDVHVQGDISPFQQHQLEAISESG
jgi:hypothetical protein